MAHFDNLGKALRRLREEKGWNQDKAARTIGVSASQLSNYETGVKRPSLETFGRLLDGYGVRIARRPPVLSPPQPVDAFGLEPPPSQPGPSPQTL
jgi:transcriptional regulator with XRE-family HTH domain